MRPRPLFDTKNRRSPPELPAKALLERDPDNGEVKELLEKLP